MISDSISVFALNTGSEYARKVVSHLNLSLSEHEEREFEDGEHKIRSLTNVRGKDVFIIQSLYSDDSLSVNDKLCRLLFLIGSLKESCARKINLIIPYLCYARKDRKTKSRDPVTTKYVAKILEVVGTDHIVTLDVHNLQAYQNAFRCYNDHLEAKNLFASYFTKTLDDSSITIMSPDAGGMKRADEFRISLQKKINAEIPLVFMEKKRSSGIVSGQSLVGDVKNKTVIIIDDLISSGTTISRAAIACKDAGAIKVYAAATHAVFNSRATENLLNEAIEKIIITDSIPEPTIDPKLMEKKIRVLDTTALMAECIERIHLNESLVQLMEG